jgi:four helix bundle protein
MSEEMVIFTRAYDLLVWLLPRTEKFPKAQRFVLTKRLQDALFDFQEAIFDGNAHSGKDRLACLRRADADLNKLRLYLRLAHGWGWLNAGQFQHVSVMVAEVGKLLGGWIKQTERA